jgi:hypothetical protein
MKAFADITMDVFFTTGLVTMANNTPNSTGVP